MISAPTVIEKKTFQDYSQINALGIKFDLAICYIPSPKAIDLLVTEKRIFKGFFTIYERGGHLGHVTSKIGINCG